MISEWLMIFIMAWCAVLFAVGGTKGKFWRRFVLPVGLVIMAIFCHVLLWKALAFGISLIVALSMGYGSKTSYPMKAVVFSTYGLSFLWLGFSGWVILTPVMCFSLFVLSNWKTAARMFFWKCVEMIYGLLLGITFISVLTNR